MMARRKEIPDEEVLEAAGRVMARCGPVRFTLAQAAIESGVAAATLVQRFGGKRGLIVRAFEHDNARFAAALASQPVTTGAEGITDLLVGWTREVEDGDVACLAEQLQWLAEDTRDPTLRALAEKRFAMMRAAILARLPETLDAPHTAARLIEAHWHGATVRWGVEQDGSLAQKMRDELQPLLALVLGPAG